MANAVHNGYVSTMWAQLTCRGGRGVGLRFFDCRLRRISLENKQTLRTIVVDRRTFIVGGAKAALLVSALCVACGGEALAVAGARSDLFEKAYGNIVGDAAPTRDLIKLGLPDLFDNGHAVPFTLSVDSPMSAEDHIETIWLLATQNPVAQVAAFHLSPESGLAVVSGRFRLAKTQDVYVVAKRSDGALFVADKLVKVTIGGCS